MSFHVRDGLPEDELEGVENFCMAKVEGKWSLKRDHSYFYQVQTQLHVCKLPYADFVVWTETGIIIERIYEDASFWEVLIGDIQHFFKYGILSEIVGKWYTRKPIADLEGVVPVIRETRTMRNFGAIAGNPALEKWYNVMMNLAQLLGFTVNVFVSDGKWYCPSCKKLQDSSKSNKRKSSKSSHFINVSTYLIDINTFSLYLETYLLI